jgi:hypothetical protein
VTAADAASAASPLAPDTAQLPASAAAARARGLGTIALVSAQLALVLLVIHRFQLESRTFFQVMLLSAVGFVVHALLPLKHRFAFFTALSLAAIVVALGPGDGFAVIGLGLVLIGICHLPFRLPLRIVLLLAVGSLFAVWRVELLPAPWSVSIWPILGSMFMFRLALYLYALRYDEKRPTLARTLAYFFMLPNVCFPLFPVIDYSTFVRAHYDRDERRIYEVGMRWIVRGLFHLILYRFVYLHLVLDPVRLRTLGDFLQFVLATYLLYLRVSGQFHVIAGVLRLFGFALPETHHLFYLASSFTDFWRRINIYWKDFMVKVVYYPAYFQLRKQGGTMALVGATIVVFLATWMLHSYQWFWLRGGFPLELQDAIFWTLLGAFVIFGSLREMARPAKRRLGRGPAWSASLALRTLATFTAICVLWSLWSSDSVMGWLTTWMVVGNPAPGDLWLLAGLVLAFLLIAGRPWSVLETADASPPLYRRPALHSAVILVALLAVGSTELYEEAAPRFARTVASLKQSTLNARDAELQHKGYYEKLDNASRMSAQLWGIQAQRPAHWVGLDQTEAYCRRDDFLRGDLRPGARISFLDQPLSTNEWGMRDRERTLSKPRGTYRIAVLGPSHVMGSGVADGETFAAFLEEDLNKSPDLGGRTRYEVLNFGIANTSLPQQLALLVDKATMFEPDAVFITDSPRLELSVVAHLRRVVSSRVAIPFPGLDLLVRQTGVMAMVDDGVPVPFESGRALLGALGLRTRMPGREADRRLRLAVDPMVQWTLGEIAAVTREHGAVPVFLALDNVEDPPSTRIRAFQDARAAGFLMFDLLDLWQGRDQAALRISDWDRHPNAAGNRLIAARLVELVREHRSQLRLEAGRAVGRAGSEGAEKLSYRGAPMLESLCNSSSFKTGSRVWGRTRVVEGGFSAPS